MSIENAPTNSELDQDVGIVTAIAVESAWDIEWLLARLRRLEDCVAQLEYELGLCE